MKKWLGELGDKYYFCRLKWEIFRNFATGTFKEDVQSLEVGVWRSGLRRDQADWSEDLSDFYWENSEKIRDGKPVRIMSLKSAFR